MNVGDVLRCGVCGHEREVTLDWLRVVCRGVPGRSAEEVRATLENELSRFKCQDCGAHALRHRAVGLTPPRTQPQTRDPARIDEGIAGTREENKRSRARQWGEMVNRGKK